ncbi:helix-turn-helix domain-containing protein [Streptomyces spectabilis]|uniref:Helix-turn-helix domain-containing protein n=1 Tax=Streptomyces spectabilis TaxID=68270 RepID=A0A5P2XGX4_STRST|nr:helix-turn-helix domain-containing protein [Streptomyces spectabilis]MBB5104403.1 transcriptional regulator with XRE-family HTH domain [Streptomyces spectabilis]MCI3905242.1 helix-turn-helix domain-containing protein [Streptomyces spectabilis]QEV62250.1 helix-turn-helix domain-containing protein [Streptomyces spectabilis]GGU99753.1 transcriptional regulator [Streptomyces spectabilis]
MSSDATPDPYADPLRFGQRVQILRERRGMTRHQLADFVGVSPHTLKKIENGQQNAPGVAMVMRIAEALRVRDLAELTGHPDMRVDLFIGPGHPRLAAVKAAVDSFALASRTEPPPMAHVKARLHAAWKARHQAPNHREVIGKLLPDLIRDSQALCRHADSAVDRRAAQVLLADAYGLCQFFVAYQPDPSLLWRVAERGMTAAQESEDPHTVGVAAWLLAQAHRDSGPRHFDAADAVNLEAVRFLEPLLPDASDDVLAIAGALQFELGYTAARRRDNGTAWRHWDKANDMAQRLPRDYYHPVTSFSRAIMGAHAVTVAVELHQGGESVRQAAKADETVIKSRPRRARHRIEEARGFHLDGQPDVAIATLEKAHRSAPETIAYNGYARRIILEEVESKQSERRRRASELAVAVGILAA